MASADAGTHAALDEALRYLEAAALRCRSEGRRKLAGVDTLARQARVSRGTLLKAVRVLVRRGVLYTRRGSGLFVVPPVLPAPPDPAGEMRHETVARELSSGIDRGELARGEPLPPAKALAERYGVSVPTLRRALRSLQTQQVLRLVRRRYVPARRPSLGHSSVLFAIPGQPNQVVSPRNYQHEEDLAAFERVCSRADIVARRLNCFYGDGDGRMVVSPSLERCARPDILGSCLGMAIVPRGINAETLSRLVGFAARHGIPVAVLGEQGGGVETLLASHAQAPGRVVLADKGPECGTAVGAMLAGLGHRCVMYVAPSDEPVWSQLRLAGLRAGMATRAQSGRSPRCPRTFGRRPSPPRTGRRRRCTNASVLPVHDTPRHAPRCNGCSNRRPSGRGCASRRQNWSGDGAARRP
jgi:DNA-binding transcriptional regulator YhcF (GntR family)